MAEKILLGIINIYKKYFSPLKPYPTCRFYPCCSCYAATAIKRFGAFRGSCLAAARLLRCNIFFPGGYDPVPEEFSLIKKKKTSDDKNL